MHKTCVYIVTSRPANDPNAPKTTHYAFRRVTAATNYARAMQEHSSHEYFVEVLPYDAQSRE